MPAVSSHLASVQMLLLIAFHSQLNLFFREGVVVDTTPPIVLFPGYENFLVKNWKQIDAAVLKSRAAQM